MKIYILKLLRKSSTDEAIKLDETLLKYYACFQYTEANSFECFYLRIPHDAPHYDFFHNYESKGEQNVEGTPIHWRVVCYDKLQIWLA